MAIISPSPLSLLGFFFPVYIARLRRNKEMGNFWRWLIVEGTRAMLVPEIASHTKCGGAAGARKRRAIPSVIFFNFD
jgi:hypothetical protein